MNLREEFNEIEIIDSLIFSIKKDCKPFLNEIKSAGRFLYRGLKRHIKDYAILKSHLEDRNTKNMPIEAHEYLNKQFKKKFGWPVRNGVFASFDIDMTASYGDPYLFFPIGKYKYAYSKKVVDLYEDYYLDLKIFNVKPNNLSGLKFELGPEHEKKYGSKTGKGTWVYKPWANKGKGKKLFAKGTTNIVDVIDRFKKALKVDDKEDILKDIVWVPDVSLDDCIKDYVEKEKKRVYKTLDNIVNLYTSTNLGDNKYVEISFNCDKYYLVKNAWRDELMDELL
jgi:hypothetical protein